MANDNSTYQQQEERLCAQSEAFIRLLTERGILGDETIKDDHIRQAQQNKRQKAYHNTELLLKNYRSISWALECFPDTVAEELERPFAKVDELLDHMDVEMSMGNRKLESRMVSVRKSRLLLDRLNEALTFLKKKPDDGEKLYELVYLTYIASETLTHRELLYRLDISSRQYYRLREQATTILSIRLWSAPAAEVDRWLDILALIEGLD